MHVYRLYNTQTGRCYVGVSKNPKVRLYKHLNLLKNRKHPSTRMQEDFEAHGLDSFRLETLETVTPPDTARQRETFWMDYYRAREDGYCHLAPTTRMTLLSGRKPGRESSFFFPKDLPELIRHQREVLGLTQKRVALAIGFGTGEGVGMVETRKRSLDLSVIPALARVLQLPELEVFRVAIRDRCPDLLKHLQPSPAEKSRENAPEREQR